MAGFEIFVLAIVVADNGKANFALLVVHINPGFGIESVSRNNHKIPRSSIVSPSSWDNVKQSDV